MAQGVTRTAGEDDLEATIHWSGVRKVSGVIELGVGKHGVGVGFPFLFGGELHEVAIYGCQHFVDISGREESRVFEWDVRDGEAVIGREQPVFEAGSREPLKIHVIPRHGIMFANEMASEVGQPTAGEKLERSEGQCVELSLWLPIPGGYGIEGRKFDEAINPFLDKEILGDFVEEEDIDEYSLMDVIPVLCHFFDECGAVHPDFGVFQKTVRDKPFLKKKT